LDGPRDPTRDQSSDEAPPMTILGTEASQLNAGCAKHLPGEIQDLFLAASG
jgi:hypothetical protein